MGCQTMEKKIKHARWENDGLYNDKEENEEYEPRQLDYDTGLPMITAVRKKDNDG